MKSKFLRPIGIAAILFAAYIGFVDSSVNERLTKESNKLFDTFTQAVASGEGGYYKEYASDCLCAQLEIDGVMYNYYSTDCWEGSEFCESSDCPI